MDALRATYELRCDASAAETRAREIALEQTAELPREAVARAGLPRDVVGRVESLREAGPGRFLAEIVYPAEVLDGTLSQILNVLFGNTSLQHDVALVDLDLDPAAAAGFGGPRLGVEGLRELTGARGRPLTATALKPVGLSAERLAELCRLFADAGVDIVKDDHGLGDQPAAPFADRVRACQEAVRQAGGRTLYVPHVGGAPSEMARRIAVARDCGVRAVMAAPMLCGLPAFHEAASGSGLAVIAHPALAGAARIAPEALLGRLFRLAGADAAVFPHAGGRFGFTLDTCARIAARLRDRWCGLRPAMPMPAGGMALERVPELISFFGADTILLIGGSLYAGGDPASRAKRFVECVRNAAT
ncbi:MAG: ribulose 1,5-bisphosphate carboxylase [Acidobacteria bacterium]|nr:MAG: ribulose 1,5-bisphosphate carboxylase [Acidobacteriota bacterium]